MTPAVEELRRAGVAHRVTEYVVDDAEVAAHGYGIAAARAMGVDPATVFKTLMLGVDDTSVAVAVVPVVADLDLKSAARALGARRARMLDTADAERRTGYVVGGISPLGQRRRHTTLVDRTLTELATCHVSAGRRGLDLAISPQDLVELLGATVADLTA